MPATITHAYFIMDIYDRLPIGLKKLLIDEKAKLRMFAQSMDAMYFYHIFSLRKGKRQRQFGHYFHDNESQAFFINLVNYIKYNGYYQKKDVMAFLYGMIAHYILDSTLHPYIIYETGWYDKYNKKQSACRNLHDEAETLLDLFMISKREQNSPYAFRLDSFCFDLSPFSKPLQEVIDHTYQETFGIHNMHTFYYQALKDMKLFLRLFRYDRIGIKKLGYTILEKVTFKKTFRFHVLSYHLPLKKANTYLNLEQNVWYHPTRKQEKHTESFEELYEIALKKAEKTIRSVNDYLQNKRQVDLEKVFPNLSYLTGKDCNKKEQFLYRREGL